MTIKKALSYGYKQLQTIADSMHHAEVDALVLLEVTIRKNKAYIYAHPEHAISSAQARTYKKYIQRRKGFEPIAYIRGTAPFFNMNLLVSPEVLIPRPETEQLTLIAAKTIQATTVTHVLDLGTGSGAVILGLQQILGREAKNKHWYASDISKPALKIAKSNAKLYAHSPISFIVSDMFSDIPEQQFDVIVSNLPYVAKDIYNTSPTNKDLSFEPYNAIVADDNGLALFKIFFETVSPFVHKRSHIFLEIGHNQGTDIKKLAMKANFNATIIKDDCDYDRIADITPM